MNREKAVMTRRKHKSQPNTDVQPVAASVAKRPAVNLPVATSHPWLLGGMTALLVARPLFPSESAAGFGDGVTMVMLWIGLAVFWLLGAVGRKCSICFGWTDGAVLLLVGWHTAAALWAVGHGTPRPAINMLWEWVGMGLCFLLARQFITTAREARAVVAVMVALAVALAGYGLFQRAYEMPETRAEYQADPDRTMRDAGLWFPPGSPERRLFESRLANEEPLATFALTNSLAAFLTPWLVMLAGVGLGCGRNRKRLIAVVVCAIPVAVCLLLTKSRSGCIAAGVGLVLAWLLCREQRVHIGWKWPAAISAIAAVLVAAAVLAGKLDREGLAQASKSFGFRLQYWQSSCLLIADHPIVGCGPGNFQNAYTGYKLPEAAEEVADPHNFLLEIAATAGTPATLAFVAVLGCFFGAIGRFQISESQISNPASESDAWLHVVAGGAVGFLLSVPVGLISAAPPRMAAVLLGLPLGAAAVMLLLGWIRDGRLPRLLPAVGVTALLVDLLATGGIGFPGVAGTLWVLLALGLFSAARPRTTAPLSDSHGRGRPYHDFGAWAGLVAAVALAAACYQTAYSPVLGCQTQLRLAEREPSRAAEHLEAAAAADPWAAEPWRQLAAVEFERWWEQPGKDTFDRFERAAAKALELAPNSASTWLTVGDWYSRALSRMDRQGSKAAAETRDHALSAYVEAARLYPNSTLYRAKLAEARRAAGDEPGFRREAEAALRLDNLTPHINKKLPAEVRSRLLQGLGRTS
jgi:hypothetical protein